MENLSRLFDRRWSLPESLVAISRVAYGGLFLLSGILKIVDLPAFKGALNGFEIVPPEFEQVVVTAIPALEIGLGILLVFGIKTSLVSGFFCAMLAVFTGVVVEKLIEGANVSCGCFGSLTSDSVTSATVLRNLLLMAWGILLSAFGSLGQRHSGPSQSKIHETDTHEPLPLPQTPPAAHQGESRARVRVVVAMTGFVFLLTLVSLLTLQNRALKNRLAIVVDRNILRAGESLPSFKVRGMDSIEQEVQYSAAGRMKTVLLIFSTRCEPCKMNLPYWTALARSLQDQEECLILAVSLDALQRTRRFAQEHALTYPVVVPNDPSFSRSYKVIGTPMTVVVDARGVVLGTWVGMLDSLKSQEILWSLENNSPASANSLDGAHPPTTAE